MWTESTIYKEDLENIIKDQNIPWAELDGKTILITGATGLIGMNIVNSILYYGMNRQNPPTVYALVRNIEKAHFLFENQEKLFRKNFFYIVGDIETIDDFPEKIDFIIHGASQTASVGFITQPVETLITAFYGTKKLLQLARTKSIKGMIFLSSMEVYGSPKKGTYISESEISGFDPLKVRNCYPISKIACENLCVSYAQEFRIPVKIIRLTQTFGPGVSRYDGRVFAEFMRCALEGKNIVLKTKGETERCYLYTADAVRAILTVLLKGLSGNAYSAANENTYCSIADMAEIVCATLGNGKSKVVYDLQDTANLGYAGTLFLQLNTRAIQNLGWKPNVNLREMYLRMAQTATRQEKQQTRG
ncbi:MAG: NAD(P)-dependent oxidoreductase [Flexilinea sp.]|nr:NAD(P)-dependent oxidoreductase [Flexilinea sp.]